MISGIQKLISNYFLIMANKIKLLVIFLLIMVSACSYPGYLPKPDHIDINQYGSHIDLDLKRGYIVDGELINDDIDGELIALDSNYIYILGYIKSHKSIMKVPYSNVEKFNLRYAKSPDYSWTIPVYTLLTISHGIYLLLTAPLNLIITTSVTLSSNKSYQYNSNQISYNTLSRFARFPQGLPPGLNIKSIK
jgi:hypothetical protein